jgi:hypothetical protein
MNIHLFFYLFLATSFTACAHTDVKNKPSSTASRESTTMNATDHTDTFNPSTLNEYPDLTPEEMGKRFLKLLNSIDSGDQLSLEHILEVTRLPLKYVTTAKVYDFSMYLPESDWTYSFTYTENNTDDALASQASKSINFEFSNPESPNVDVAPVCGKNFDAYVADLKKIGFVMGPEMIDMDSGSIDRHETNKHFIERHIFRLSSKTGLLSLSGSIVEQRQDGSTNKTPNYSCLKSITVAGVAKQ